MSHRHCSTIVFPSPLANSVPAGTRRTFIKLGSSGLRANWPAAYLPISANLVRAWTAWPELGTLSRTCHQLLKKTHTHNAIIVHARQPNASSIHYIGGNYKYIP